MADEYAWQPSLGVRLVGGTAHARVWAPDAATVAVRDAAGIHQEPPVPRPEFRQQTRKALARLAQQRASEAMI